MPLKINRPPSCQDESSQRAIKGLTHSDRASDHDMGAFEIIDESLNREVDIEQHKARRDGELKKRSIRQYRHATSKWGATLESFGPVWASDPVKDVSAPC